MSNAPLLPSIQHYLTGEQLKVIVDTASIGRKPVLPDYIKTPSELVQYLGLENKHNGLSMKNEEQWKAHIGRFGLNRVTNRFK